MKRLVALAVLSAAWAQSPANLTPGSLLQADLGSELQSAGAQVGDQITATLSAAVKQGSTSLPKGTVLDGHVTQAVASTTESGGHMAVLFDRAITPNGKTFNLLAGIQSVKTASSSSSSRTAAPARGGRRGGYGGGYPGGGYPGGSSTSPPPSSSTPSSAPPAAPSIPDIRFPADAATEGSILSAPHGDVWVAPGAKLVLQVMAAPAS